MRSAAALATYTQDISAWLVFDKVGDNGIMFKIPTDLHICWHSHYALSRRVCEEQSALALGTIHTLPRGVPRTYW